MTVTLVRYLILIRKACIGFTCSIFTVLDSVLTPQSSLTILHYASYFQLSFRCLEMWSKLVFRD